MPHGAYDSVSIDPASVPGRAEGVCDGLCDVRGLIDQMFLWRI